MIILGIDPGYGRVGWGLISFQKQKAEYIDCGLLETKVNSDFYLRIEKIYNFMQKIIKKYKPDVLAIESVFFNTNQKTAILTSQARGVIAIAGINQKLPVFDYTPLQVKNALIGYGRADKKQIQAMLSYHLTLKQKIKQDDAADALAVALTHAYTNQKML
jgi:crossover junction endodeoxyribonuclease RuvC